MATQGGTKRLAVRRGGLAEEIAAHVRSLILTGGLRPGEKIDQEAIATALDVSRSPIREALVVLGQEGLLDLTPRRGAFVAELTREDIIDHYELFGLISGRVAEMAAASLTDDEIDQLKLIHKRYLDGPVDDHAELNTDFHTMINQCAPRRTRWLLGHLERSIPANFYDFVDDWDEAAAAGHDAILSAITSRDAASALEAMERHLHQSGVAAADSLLARGFWK